MDVWIRFIGLILLYQAAPDAQYRAILPKWNNDTICERTIVKHEPFIRVGTGRDQIVDDSQWPEKEPCDDDLDCIAYAIPVNTTLTIETGFQSARAKPDTLPCLVPEFRRERLVTNPTLHDDALTTRSTATYTVPNGELFAHQFDNAAIFAALKVPAPAGAVHQNIRIIATPRNDPRAAAHVLEVKPGTVIDILNVPSDQATEDYDHIPSAEEMELHPHRPEDHFFFLHKLLNATSSEEDCNFFPLVAQGTCEGPRVRLVQNENQALGPGTSHGLGCGPGGLVAGSGHTVTKRGRK